MAKKTGIHKTSTLGHVNLGKGASSNSLEAYAKAFTMQLKREITVQDLLAE